MIFYEIKVCLQKYNNNYYYVFWSYLHGFSFLLIIFLPKSKELLHLAGVHRLLLRGALKTVNRFQDTEKNKDGVNS